MMTVLPLLFSSRETLEALALEGLVPDGEHLVDQEDVRLHVDRHREAQAHVHARGVILHRLVDVLADPGEVDDVVELGVELFLLEAQDGAVEEDVLAPGELGVETGTELEEGRHLPRNRDRTLVGPQDPGQALEHRGFTRAVFPDEARRRALVDLEADVVERPKDVHLRPPAAHHRRLQRLVALTVQAVFLGNMVCDHNGQAQRAIAPPAGAPRTCGTP